MALICLFMSACDMPNRNLAGIHSNKISIKSGMDEKITKIMSKMTLADKVGEMTQLSIDVLSVGSPYNLKEPHELDPKKLQEILVDYKVGSILNCGGHA
ncbi:MAG: beta-glucosidase, partial [Saprospiraceae bacterium]